MKCKTIYFHLVLLVDRDERLRKKLAALCAIRRKRISSHLLYLHGNKCQNACIEVDGSVNENVNGVANAFPPSALF